MVIVTGFKEVDNLMRRLPKELNHKIVGSAIYKSAKPLVTGAKARVKSKTGNLKESIGAVRQSIKKATEIGEVRVGPRLGGRFKGYHGYNVETGHRVVLGGTLPASQTKSGRQYQAKNPARTGQGRVVGKADPHPFLQPAFVATKGEVMNQINNNIAISLRNSMRRLLKKQGAWNG
jgi:hypothetical protein